MRRKPKGQKGSLAAGQASVKLVRAGDVAVQLLAPTVDTASSRERTAAGHRRYVETEALSALLLHDSALGGTPVRLVRARWLLETFCHSGTSAVLGDRSTGAILGHRQRLERDYPQRGPECPFASEEMLERLMHEVDESYEEKEDGPFANAVMTFPAVVVLSHCWLALEHPDPEARNLREKWLPALEWYFSERVQRACVAREPQPWMKISEVRRAAWAGASDAELLERCDFGVFIDLTAMCQKDAAVGARTEVEDRLFKHALSSLDVLFAHRGAVSFLSTALPEGFERGVNLVPGLNGDEPVRGYQDRGWTGFEQSLGHLIKKSEHCLDIGRFRADEAAKIATKRFSDKTVAELRKQASYHPANPGVLSSLIVGSRGPPLVPAAFDAEILATRRFTNGADSQVVASMYEKTAEALLASTPTLEFTRLAHWEAAQFGQLGAALLLTRALETLVLHGMPLNNEGARALVSALPRTLRTLKLTLCQRFTELPALPALPSLRELDLTSCKSLAALPDLSGLVSLQQLDLYRCLSLAALPDLKGLSSLQRLVLSDCYSLAALPDLSGLSSLQRLNLSRSHLADTWRWRPILLLRLRRLRARGVTVEMDARG